MASFFSDEGTEPPHVHMRHAGGEVKLWLRPVRIVWQKKLNKPEIRQAFELVRKHEGRILEAWTAYFDR